MKSFSEMRMVCLGDSLTMGQGIETPYCILVKEELTLREVYNYGIGWSTVADGRSCSCHPGSYSAGHTPFIDRYPLMPPAEIIAVCGGANDHGVNVPLGESTDTVRSTFYGALNLLITGLKEKYPDAYIFFMTPFDYNTVNDNGIHLSEYAAAIKKVCAIHGTDCYDCYSEMPIITETDTLDGIHPTQKYVTNIWAPGIAKYIREHLMCDNHTIY